MPNLIKINELRFILFILSTSCLDHYMTDFDVCAHVCARSCAWAWASVHALACVPVHA